MPQTKLLFYMEPNGESPVYAWFMALRKKDPKAWANCRVRLAQLANTGHELRRPASDYLRDDIRELRAKHGNIQYRILYFFHGQNVAVLAHGMIKKGSGVDDTDIERAIQRREAFRQNPEAHTFVGETDNG